MREGGVTGFVRWLPAAHEADALDTAARAARSATTGASFHCHPRRQQMNRFTNHL